MEEILQEIHEFKTQQLAFNNLMLENSKQNEMILIVLKELLKELQEEKAQEGFRDVVENILVKLDVLIEKFDSFKED